MSDGMDNGCLVPVMWIFTVLLSIGSGVLAWNWTDPDSFLSAIFFIVIWGILTKVAHFILFGVIMVLFDS
jgi:hypothetical protein